MLSFENDYNNGCCPEILQRLTDTNGEQSLTYGDDEWTHSARRKIARACQCEQAQVFFLTGGTQTNMTVIDALLHGYESVITVTTGHIAVHEAGAIEFCGHKVIALPGHEGRLDAADLDAYMTAWMADETHAHRTRPAMVYVSFPTELGTIYTASQLRALREVCNRHGLLLYVDGARLGYGLAASRGDVTLPVMAQLADAFYIGGTKQGALCGEAVVFPRPEVFPPYFFTIVKQHGALLAKGRLAGLQFDTLFTDDLYLTLSRHAVAMAMRLRDLFMERGYRLAVQSPTNQQFIILPNDLVEHLDPHVQFSHITPHDAASQVCRFVTSWSTTAAQLEQLARLLRD